MSSIEERVAAEAAHYENDADVPVPDDVMVTRPNQAKSVILSVRLNPEEDAAIRQIAERVGVPVSTIVRALIVQRIATDRGRSDDPEAAFVTVVNGLQRIADGLGLPGLGWTGGAAFGMNVQTRTLAVSEEINSL